ncbi:hypothetical protein [Sulfuricystis thermophila]|jgi:hypothetical protein|uniref:hypothetical protein n=1 Tax=Sulfuricystis thermophila TaxID=2496847 RepID=UPI001035FE06|nr:hypothetical protein [Sulfuricystis thermophila]
MLFLRIVGILAAIAIGAGIISFLFTGDRRYLGLSWRIAKYALIFALVLFALLALERLMVIF